MPRHPVLLIGFVGMANRPHQEVKTTSLRLITETIYNRGPGFHERERRLVLTDEQIAQMLPLTPFVLQALRCLFCGTQQLERSVIFFLY